MTVDTLINSGLLAAIASLVATSLRQTRATDALTVSVQDNSQATLALAARLEDTVPERVVTGFARHTEVVHYDDGVDADLDEDDPDDEEDDGLDDEQEPEPVQVVDPVLQGAGGRARHRARHR